MKAQDICVFVGDNTVNYTEPFFFQMSEKILVVFDFDHTLIDDNSDLYVRKLAPGGKLPQYIKDKYR